MGPLGALEFVRTKDVSRGLTALGEHQGPTEPSRHTEHSASNSARDRAALRWPRALCLAHTPQALYLRVLLQGELRYPLSTYKDTEAESTTHEYQGRAGSRGAWPKAMDLSPHCSPTFQSQLQLDPTSPRTLRTERLEETRPIISFVALQRSKVITSDSRHLISQVRKGTRSDVCHVHPCIRGHQRAGGRSKALWLPGHTCFLCATAAFCHSGSAVCSWIEPWFLIKVTSAEKTADVRRSPPSRGPFPKSSGSLQAARGLSSQGPIRATAALAADTARNSPMWSVL